MLEINTVWLCTGLKDTSEVLNISEPDSAFTLPDSDSDKVSDSANITVNP